jgi:hypothetical protein
VEASGSLGAGKQCVPDDGQCACPAQAIASGASTTCSVSNDLGTCLGARTCGIDGLSACSAPAPAAEVCNGVDDDCDGSVDEDLGFDGCEISNAFGTCVGDEVCADGVLVCGAITPAAEACNGIDDNCDGTTDEGFDDLDGDGVADCADPDVDGDGVANEDDCAPANLAISPSATEACNGIDDDCDGLTDEVDADGCTLFYVDADLDGDGSNAPGDVPQCLCAPTGDYTALAGGDCDDAAADISSLATETCDDVDDDCDGKVDEGCDDDSDGWCDASMSVEGLPAVCPSGLGDCDDLAPKVYPGQPEACGNGLDDDCDGQVDAGEGALGCVAFYEDVDKDGFGTKAEACLCGPAGSFTAKNADDCDDAEAGAYPGAPELCGNGIDDNCNGQIDEQNAVGCVEHYIDGDGDGFGAGDPVCTCGPIGPYQVTKDGDCDDSDPLRSPAAVESCNALDDDCDGKADEQNAIGCSTYYQDADSDGYGDVAQSACLCAPTVPYTVVNSGDCDDTNGGVSPAGAESCDTFDNDCDGAVDETGATGCVDHFIDSDGDGFGAPATAACLCAMAPPFNTIKGDDCDDANVSVNPGVPESCDGDDNNCDGKIDEAGALGCFAFLRDEDTDGYGLDGISQCLCTPKAPYTASQGGDCDDNKKAVNPKAIEACDNIDNDCDGLTDSPGADGCTPYYVDADKDGYGTFLAVPKCLCQPAAPHVAAVGGDCNDNDGQTYPNALEKCDGKDTDCDSIVDPLGAQGCTQYYADGDSDGWGIANLSQCACAASGAFTATQPGDCDDQSGAIHPGVPEACNGIDDDCDNQTDEGAPGANTYWIDNDGDGWGGAASKTQCGPGGGYTATKGGDCNDNNGQVNPGKAEISCNGIDDDCVGGDNCNPLPHPCNSTCGSYNSLNSCWCDSACKSFGDCCSLFGGQTNSCAGSTCGTCQ